MELIEALEQLSLRVRYQERENISKTGTSRPTRISETGQFEQTHNNDKQEPTSKWHDNETYCYDEDLQLKQLKDFDSSLETLISQISDLDHKSQETVSIKPNNTCPSNSTRPNDFYLWRRKRFHSSIYGCNSMETSQEEDSDSSSQFSSNVDSASLASQASSSATSSKTHPLVNHLMKRDLSGITDTVRRIGRILAIGNELETISKNCDTQYMNDNKYATSLYDLCNEFRILCSAVHCICDLPTIKHYSDCCRIVLNRLNKIAMMTEAYNENLDDDSSMMMTDDDEEDCDEEVTLLTANQSNLNSWTDNKLYNGLE